MALACFITNHKTGTKLIQGVLKKYEDTVENNSVLWLNRYMEAGEIRRDIQPQDYKFLFAPHCQHFSIFSKKYNNVPIRYCHWIRNPMDIILSGARYHVFTQENWCHRKVFAKHPFAQDKFIFAGSYSSDVEGATHSYQEAISSLHALARIEFEVLNHRGAHGTISHIEKFLETSKDEGIGRTQLLENHNDEIEAITQFLGLQSDIYEIMVEMSHDTKWLGNHVTKEKEQDDLRKRQRRVAKSLILKHFKLPRLSQYYQELANDSVM